MGRFAKRSMGTLLASGMRFGVELAHSILIARFLGPEGKGIYSLAVLVPSLLTTLGNLGISPATTYLLGRGRHKANYIFSTLTGLSLVISVVGLGVGCTLVLSAGTSFLRGVPVEYSLIALLVFPFRLLLRYSRSVQLGLQRFGRYNMLVILRPILLLVLTVLIVVVLRMGTLGALAATVAAGLCGAIVSFQQAKRQSEPVEWIWNKQYAREALVYGVKAHIGNVAGYLNYRIDIFLVGALANPLSVGYYSIAVAIAERLWLISQAASTVLFPRVAAEQDEKRLRDFTPLVVRNTLLMSMLSACILLLLSRWLLTFLYSDAFLKSVRPLQLLLPGIIALSGARVLANDIAGRGFPQLNSYVGAMGVAVNVGLNLLWIPRWGIAGAALASTVSYTAILIMRTWLYCRISGNSAWKTLVVRREDFGLYVRLAKSLLRKTRGS